MGGWCSYFNLYHFIVICWLYWCERCWIWCCRRRFNLWRGECIWCCCVAELLLLVASPQILHFFIRDLVSITQVAKKRAHKSGAAQAVTSTRSEVQSLFNKLYNQIAELIRFWRDENLEGIYFFSWSFNYLLHFV